MSKSNYLLIGALAAAGLCQSAFALNQTDVNAVVGTVNELFLSGATASDPAVKQFIQNDLCVAGTYDIYQDAATSGTNYYAMTCTMKGAAPVPASLFNQNVIIHKRSKIGSIYGVYPIAKNSYVEFLNLQSTRTAGSCNPGNTTGSGPYNCPATVLAGLPRHATNAAECDYANVAPTNPVVPTLNEDTICRRSSMGIADVESEMFTGVNLTNQPGDNFATLSGSEIGGTTRSRVFGQLFGVAISSGLWNALQQAQIVSSAWGAPAADFSNVPNLSKDQIRAVLLGAAPTWTAVAGSLNNVSGFAASTLNNVNICRREQGSGSQASSNQFFLNYPCDTTFAPKQDNTATWVSGVWAKENFSSGAAKNCLSDSESAGANANAARQAGAIGVLSFNGDPGASDKWKWIKVDGVMPTYTNSMLGLSDLWYETQLSYNATNQTTQETDLATTLFSEMAKATRITSSAAKGIAGLGLSTNGNGTWDSASNNTGGFTAYTATNPVLGGHHGLPNSGYPASGTPLSCRPILNYVDATTGPNR